MEMGTIFWDGGSNPHLCQQYDIELHVIYSLCIFLSFSLRILTLFTIRENFLDFSQYIRINIVMWGLVLFVSMSTLLIFNYYNFYLYVMKDILCRISALANVQSQSRKDKKYKGSTIIEVYY